MFLYLCVYAYIVSLAMFISHSSFGNLQLLRSHQELKPNTHIHMNQTREKHKYSERNFHYTHNNLQVHTLELTLNSQSGSLPHHKCDKPKSNVYKGDKAHQNSKNGLYRL